VGQDRVLLSEFPARPSCFEAEAVVAGFQEVAVMSEPVVIWRRQDPAHSLKLRLVVMMRLVRS